MAFITVTDAESGNRRTLNTDFIIYVEADAEGPNALVWWVSYSDPGQPRSKYLLCKETYEDVAKLVGAQQP